jgi:hypothetical protein
MMTLEEQLQIHNERVRLFRGLKYPGTNCLKYAREIRTFVSQNKIHSLLDYGAGQGEQYTQGFDKLIGIPKADIDLFDIGVPSHNKLPKNIYDCVLISDVVQYIPEDIFELEFNKIYGRGKTVFAIVDLNSTDPNAAVKGKPVEWWDEVFCSFPHLTQVIYYGSTVRTSGVRKYHGGARIG